MKKEDIYSNCLLIQIYNLLGKRWSLQIFHTFIEEDNMSYSALDKKFNRRINPTILSKRLKRFVELKLIEEENKKYSLTKFGKKISKKIHEIKLEAINHGIYIPKQCVEGECLCKS